MMKLSRRPSASLRAAPRTPPCKRGGSRAAAARRRPPGAAGARGRWPATPPGAGERASSSTSARRSRRCPRRCARLSRRCLGCRCQRVRTAGRGVEGICRPDKLVAYFDSRDDLRRAVESLRPRLAGCATHGVPLLAADGSGHLPEWRADPPRSADGPAESWRLWVAERLAEYLSAARSGARGRRALAVRPGAAAASRDRHRYLGSRRRHLVRRPGGGLSDGHPRALRPARGRGHRFGLRAAAGGSRPDRARGRRLHRHSPWRAHRLGCREDFASAALLERLRRPRPSSRRFSLTARRRSSTPGARSRTASACWAISRRTASCWPPTRVGRADRHLAATG